MNLMNSLDEWFPISHVSEKVDIPPETIRRYARKYSGYLVLKRGEKKAYLIHESSLATIKRIRHLLEQGHHHEQVKNLLGKPEVIDANVKQEETAIAMINPPQLYKEMMEEIQKLSQQNIKLLESLKQMHERMNGYEAFFMQQQAFSYEESDGQENELRDYERKRDEYLMRAMNEIQDRKKETASSKEKNKLFTKLFRLRA